MKMRDGTLEEWSGMGSRNLCDRKYESQPLKEQEEECTKDGEHEHRPQGRKESLTS